MLRIYSSPAFERRYGQSRRRRRSPSIATSLTNWLREVVTQVFAPKSGLPPPSPSSPTSGGAALRHGAVLREESKAQSARRAA